MTSHSLSPPPPSFPLLFLPPFKLTSFFRSPGWPWQGDPNGVSSGGGVWHESHHWPHLSASQEALWTGQENVQWQAGQDDRWGTIILYIVNFVHLYWMMQIVWKRSSHVHVYAADGHRMQFMHAIMECSLPLKIGWSLSITLILVVMKMICAGQAFAKVTRFLRKHTGMHAHMVPQ